MDLALAQSTHQHQHRCLLGGRKRHVAVDCSGLMLAIMIAPAAELSQFHADAENAIVRENKYLLGLRIHGQEVQRA